MTEMFVAAALGLIEAVVSINDADVVHRDVKPDNVLLTSPEKGSPGGARVLMVDPAAAITKLVSLFFISVLYGQLV